MHPSDRWSCERGLKVMNPNDRKRGYRKDMLLASALVMAGLVVSGLSVARLAARNPQMAQATQPLQSSPPAEPNNTPAESKPGGARPTTPAPEPARPDAAAQTTGAAPALPSAPAEKTGAPIKDR
jgi:hypothetical protein